MDRLPRTIEQAPLTALLELNHALGFSLKLKELGLWQTGPLFSSLDTSGILEPVLILKNREKASELLLDGFKRLEWARSRDIETVPVIKLNLLKKDALSYLLQKHGHELTSCSLIALFLDFLERAGFGQETIIEKVMPSLGLQGHRGLLKKYQRVASLPVDVLALCHEKDFSLKRCLNLTHQPSQLLERLTGLGDRLALSASLFLELCDSISDIMRRDEISVEAFFDKEEIRKILESDSDRATTTKLFREHVRKLRNPILTGLQEELEKIDNSYFKSAPFSIRWDKTLENKRIEIKASITDVSQLPTLSQTLSSEKTRKGIKKLLSYF